MPMIEKTRDYVAVLRQQATQLNELADTLEKDLGSAARPIKRASAPKVSPVELVPVAQAMFSLRRRREKILPHDRVVGISKLARVLHGFARRLQVQERLTAEVADCIWENLQPQGVAVVIEASHSCMTARGVKTPGVGMVTSRMMGTFLDDHRSREEVLRLMGYG